MRLKDCSSGLVESAGHQTGISLIILFDVTFASNKTQLALPTLIITSAAFVEGELEAELGKLPPAFLPIGGKRLFERQYMEFTDRASRVILSLPETFSVDDLDNSLLSKLGIEVVFLPENLSLGSSIVFVINVTALCGQPIMLLHGDTLLTGINEITKDSLSVSLEPQLNYQWGRAKLNGCHTTLLLDDELSAPDAVLTGFFVFSDSNRLIKCITRENGSFLRGLQTYGSENDFHAVYSENWFDFGHVGTYYRSRRSMATQRAFNSLQISPRVVTKASVDQTKILAEAKWFEEIPNDVRLHTPTYLGRQTVDGTHSYSLEYLYLPTLSDLFVFGRKPLIWWRKLFDAVDEVLTLMASHKAPGEILNKNVKDLYLEKTIARLEMYSKSTGFDINKECRIPGYKLPSVSKMVEISASAITKFNTADSTLIHGDFCFSNLFFDGRSSLIRMIDPRGLDAEGNFSLWGDPRYDLAKLYHSVIGMYDHIVAGRFELCTNSPYDLALYLPSAELTESIGDEFMNRTFAGSNAESSDSLPISILLFFAMLPLHCDDNKRQLALLANGLRLFYNLCSK